jgi:hypothetical protein
MLQSQQQAVEAWHWPPLTPWKIPGTECNPGPHNVARRITSVETTIDLMRNGTRYCAACRLVSLASTLLCTGVTVVLWYCVAGEEEH